MQFDTKVMLREHWPIFQTRFTSHSQVQQKRCAAVSVQVVAGGISKFHLLRRSTVEAAFGLSCKVGSGGGSGRVGTTGGGREGGRSCEKRRRLSRSRRRWQELLGPSYSASSSTNWYSLDDIAVGSDTIVDFANPRSTQLAQPKYSALE